MEFLLFIPLVRLIRSDFRKRRVKITDLLLFGCLQLFVSWWGVGWKELVFRLKGNGWVFLFMVTGVVLYVFIRYGQGRRVMRRLGGIGDGWFCLMLAPAFTLRTYVYFLILAFLLTFCGWEIYRRVSGRRVTIPLVSGMGLMYMVFLTIRF
ncbi:hypothetical protein [Odoribacter laneus]|jgi:hypothetical protein|uniref:hypothetical protein n=1 Tax=Odoribacter laneus TaxID=626933 RepID=UPI003AB345FD